MSMGAPHSCKRTMKGRKLPVQVALRFGPLEESSVSRIPQVGSPLDPREPERVSGSLREAANWRLKIQMGTNPLIKVFLSTRANSNPPFDWGSSSPQFGQVTRRSKQKRMKHAKTAHAIARVCVAMALRTRLAPASNSSNDAESETKTQRKTKTHKPQQTWL